MKVFEDYSTTVRLFLLQALTGKRNVFDLKRAGYSFTQILDILESAKVAGMVEMVEGKLALSNLGVQTHRQLVAAQPHNTARTWLVELPSDRMPPMSTQEIYVPPLRDLQ